VDLNSRHLGLGTWVREGRASDLVVRQEEEYWGAGRTVVVVLQEADSVDQADLQAKFVVVDHLDVGPVVLLPVAPVEVLPREGPLLECPETLVVPAVALLEFTLACKCLIQINGAR
jgi:hypothetical protein